MSLSPSPYASSYSRYYAASPSPVLSLPPFIAPIASGSRPSSSRSTPKPVNIFTNDGSFLERVQRSKRLEEEKKKQQELEERKKTFDNRFKNRGKRPAPVESNDPSSADAVSPPDSPPSKKIKQNSLQSGHRAQVNAHSRGNEKH